jgi:hypothetical protein
MLVEPFSECQCSFGYARRPTSSESVFTVLLKHQKSEQHCAVKMWKFLLHSFCISFPQQCRVLVSPQRPSGAMRIAAALSSLEWVLPARVCLWPTRFACPTVWNAAAFLCVSRKKNKSSSKIITYKCSSGPVHPLCPTLRTKARVGDVVECSDSPLLPHGHASRSLARSVGGSHRGHRTR